MEKSFIKNNGNYQKFELNQITIEGTKIILNQMINCMCKIIIDDKNTINGFFMKIPNNSINLSLLITNKLILNKIEKKNSFIELTMNDDKIYKKIELNNSRKITKFLKYDIVIIEIFPKEDKINDYLELDDNINKEEKYLMNDYNNNSIYSLEFNKENNVVVLYNILKNIKNDNNDSNIYPILSLNTFKIIGIKNKYFKSNFNIFKNLINEFKKQYNKTRNELNELSIKYIVQEKGQYIKIFDKTFVNNNRKNCRLFINGNEIELTDYIYLNTIKLNENILEVKLKEINKITNMSYMFYNCLNLISFRDLENWNTSNVVDINSIFFNCTMLTHLPDISKWDISSVINMSSMFYNCSFLQTLPDISKWNTKNVKYMNDLFFGCSSLLSLPDISIWNTSKVIGMGSMFRMCSSLLYLPDISKWNTSNVKNMSELFFGCRSISILPDISNWNTKNVINMIGMFANCSSLVSLPDLSHWNTKQVWNMNGMFYGCTSLAYLTDISNWNINKVIKKAAIFNESINLIKTPDKFK